MTTNKSRMLAVLSGLCLIAFAFAATLTLAPRTASADCYSSNVCTYSYGRRVCRSSSACTAPRVRTCSFVSRCYPQRSCVSQYGRTTCMVRDVCRREQVCN
jgi:hypothetical protein